jgi:3-methyl-2-oxobutanoate hydroxymethyltransferase
MNILQFKAKKKAGQKISVITCYDYSSARIANTSQVDAILVGDSLAMTMLGEKSTLPVSIDMMAEFTSAVAKGAPDKLIIGDMPFLSYRKSLSECMTAVEKLMQAGAQAIKLEGLAGNESFVSHIVESGVPVMGHLGLTPQAVHQLGGYRVQGRDTEGADLIIESSKQLEKLGAFSVVLECVPSSVAATISKTLNIPIIGIGAGPETDGQVLVWQDLLGMNLDFQPKFVRKYLSGADQIRQALDQYANDVSSRQFPSIEESYE